MRHELSDNGYLGEQLDSETTFTIHVDRCLMGFLSFLNHGNMCTAYCRRSAHGRVQKIDKLTGHIPL